MVGTRDSQDFPDGGGSVGGALELPHVIHQIDGVTGPPEGVEVKVVDDDAGELGEGKLGGRRDTPGEGQCGDTTATVATTQNATPLPRGKSSPKHHPLRGAMGNINGDNPPPQDDPLLANSHLGTSLPAPGGVVPACLCR